MAVQSEKKEIVKQEKAAPLKIRNEKFCQIYALTGNATQSYIQAYGMDKNNTSQYMTAGVNANRLLKNAKVCNRINELLVNVLNPANLDTQLSFLIQQHEDKRTKLQAIKHGNELLRRVEKSNTTITGNTFNLGSLLDKANIIEG